MQVVTRVADDRRRGRKKVTRVGPDEFNSMELKRGIAVSPGVAIGPALVLGSEDFRIPRRFVQVDAVDTELARLHAALAASVAEIAGHEQLAAARLGQQYGAIFAAHRQLAQDPKLIQ